VLLALGVVHDVVHHRVHILVLERRQVDAAYVAMDADHGRQAGRQVKVGSLVLDREGEQFGDVHGFRLYEDAREWAKTRAEAGAKNGANAAMLYFSPIASQGNRPRNMTTIEIGRASCRERL